jgi:hypothetical protein
LRIVVAGRYDRRDFALADVATSERFCGEADDGIFPSSRRRLGL